MNLGRDGSTRASAPAVGPWLVLALNLAVVLWGAYVRASGSGAGCGSHWPLCNGVVIPLEPAQATLIEFVHRLMSAAALLSVVVLWVWARRGFGAGTSIRGWASAALGLIFAEALIGAGLVLFGWVAEDASIGRAVSVPLHLGVTFALLAALALVAWHAGEKGGSRKRGPGSGVVPLVLAGGMVLAGMTGALTALGDTLFPSETIAGGLAADFEAGQHFMIRLRVVHPLLAVLVALGVLLWARRALRLEAPSPVRRTLLRSLQGLVIVQVIAGAINVLLLAPVWIQLLHLLLADLSWLALVLSLAAASQRPLPGVGGSGA